MSGQAYTMRQNAILACLAVMSSAVAVTCDVDQRPDGGRWPSGEPPEFSDYYVFLMLPHFVLIDAQ